MYSTTAPETDRTIVDSRAMIEASRRHLASIKRGLKDAQTYVEAIRRDLNGQPRDVQK